MIYDIENEEVIYNKYMNKKLVLKIVEICEKNSIYYSIYTPNCIIAPSLKYNILFYNNENVHKTSQKKTKINLVNNIYEYIVSSNIKEFSKVTICDKDQVIFKRYY